MAALLSPYIERAIRDYALANDTIVERFVPEPDFSTEEVRWAALLSDRTVLLVRVTITETPRG